MSVTLGPLSALSGSGTPEPQQVPWAHHHNHSTAEATQRKPCGLARRLHATGTAFITGFSGIRQIKSAFHLLMYQEVAVS